MKCLLLCFGGFSTGLMKTKLEEQAKKQGFVDTTFYATAISEAEADIGDYDVYLLGPQVRYAYEDIKKLTKDKPLIQISTQDFGLMRADNVWKQIEEAIGVNKA